MLNVYKYEGKTKEECLKKCLEELNIEEKDLLFYEQEKEGNLFKSKKFELEVVNKIEILSSIKEFIKELSRLMNIEINSEVKEKEGIYNAILVSDNNNILIGKDGKNLSSIQLLIRQNLNVNNRFNIKINVDVSDYKMRKQKNLEYEIRKISHDILINKIAVELDPMNSFDRRIVHNVVGEFKELTSESFGEGIERHVVIKYKED